jgi:hypothetical protein
MDDRVWTRRLRWRMRGARLWPVFALLTLLDGVLLHVNPVAGDSTAIVSGILLAGFLNLIGLVVLAPPLSRLLRRRRPVEIADDRAGTAVVLAVSAVLLVLGFAHSGAVGDAKRTMAAQLAAARRYFAANAPPEYRAHRGQIDTWKQSDDFFRTCIPGADRDHALCVFVSTDVSPPSVRLDPNHVPNPIDG